tara:strand:+ start:384 stop:1247 length:864 start_codon:yes stop_codon:yes gene_type:complete
MNKFLASMASIVRKVDKHFKFTILEIGALQVSNNNEPFYKLLDLFPESKIIGFEVDKELCATMNSTSPTGVKYYPHALGQFNEKRKFYVTRHQMCCSLYEPNKSINNLYNNLEAADLLYETDIETVSLDFFVKENQVGPIDFIKIDVQGAELDIFKGARKTLKNVLQIVSEVYLLPQYKDQPLFGEVCNFLDKQNLMFNKFLGMGGRSLKPVIMNNNPNAVSQNIWTDAVFIRHVQKMENLTNQQLLKLSLLACLYGSTDLSFYCLSQFDTRQSTSLAKEWFETSQT